MMKFTSEDLIKARLDKEVKENGNMDTQSR